MNTLCPHPSLALLPRGLEVGSLCSEQSADGSVAACRSSEQLLDGQSWVKKAKDSGHGRVTWRCAAPCASDGHMCCRCSLPILCLQELLWLLQWNHILPMGPEGLQTLTSAASTNLGRL